jgi:hypothetical protein
MRGHNTGVGLYSVGGYITAWFASQHSHSPVSLLLPKKSASFELQIIRYAETKFPEK